MSVESSFEVPVFWGKNKNKKGVQTAHLATECFCLYILLFSTCKIFQHLISPIWKFTKRSWNWLFRSARLMIRMMQCFLKLQKCTRRKSWLLSGAVFVPVSNMGLLTLHVCLGVYNAVQLTLQTPEFHIPTVNQSRIESAGAKPQDAEGQRYSSYCTILFGDVSICGFWCPQGSYNQYP